jgi:hypothetical protein
MEYVLMELLEPTLDSMKSMLNQTSLKNHGKRLENVLIMKPSKKIHTRLSTVKSKPLKIIATRMVITIQ